MKTKFIIIVMLQIALLVGIIAYRQYWLSNGERILLRTVPVDPRDIFRGDYVHLAYEIGRLDLDNLKVKETFHPNERIYVTIKKDADGIYEAVSASGSPAAGGKFIRGRARSETERTKWDVSIRDDAGKIRTFRPRWFNGFSKGDRVTFCLDKQDRVTSQFKEDSPYKRRCGIGRRVGGTIEDIRMRRYRQLNVEYGIESYFVEEGRGREIERARNAGNLKVEVSLLKDGSATIAGLLTDGKKEE